MLTTYTKAQMLNIWRDALGYNFNRLDCMVEQYEGLDVNTTITNVMRRWYLKQLDKAPFSLLAVTDIGPELTAKDAGHGCMTYDLPENCRRIVLVNVNGWMHPVEPDQSKKAADKLLRRNQPYAKPGVASPVATVAANIMFAAPATPDSTVTAYAILDPGPDTYILDDSLLDTIPRKL